MSAVRTAAAAPGADAVAAANFDREVMNPMLMVSVSGTGATIERG